MNSTEDALDHFIDALKSDKQGRTAKYIETNREKRANEKENEDLTTADFVFGDFAPHATETIKLCFK